MHYRNSCTETGFKAVTTPPHPHIEMILQPFYDMQTAFELGESAQPSLESSSHLDNADDTLPPTYKDGDHSLNRVLST